MNAPVIPSVEDRLIQSPEALAMSGGLALEGRRCGREGRGGMSPAGGADDAAERGYGILAPWPVDLPIPNVLLIVEVLRVTRMKPARFFMLKRIGKLPPWIVELPTLGHPRYCGKTLAKWAAGEWNEAATTRRRRRQAMQGSW